MPTIPGNIQENALPGVRVRPDNSILEAAQLGAQPGEEAQKAVKEEAARVDNSVATEAMSHLVDLKNNILHGPDGAYSKLGKNAVDLEGTYLPAWQAGAQKVLDGLTANQKAMLSPVLSEQTRDLKGTLAVHEDQQRQKYFLDSSEAAIQSLQADTLANYKTNPAKVDENLKAQVSEVAKQAKWMGWSPERTQLEAQKVADANHLGIIQDLIQHDDYPRAQAYFNEKAKSGQLSKASQEAILPHLQNAQVISLGTQLWGKYQGFKLADGTPDVGRMLADIQKQPGLTDEQKIKVESFIHGKAGEQRVILAQKEQATDEQFKNAAVEAKKNGVPLEKALLFVPNFSKDPSDQAQKEDTLRKLYAPPADSDKAAHYQLWEGIQNGRVTAADLDQAKSQGLINPSDWFSLRQQLFETTAKGTNIPLKSAYEQIKTMADGSVDKKKIPDFMDYMIRQGQGKDPSEVLKMAQDELKKPHWWGGTRAWETHLKQEQDANMAWGTLYQDLGKDQVGALGEAVMRQNKTDRYSPEDLKPILEKFGGYDAFKKGTPANDAVLWLKAQGWPVVPENIQWAIAQRQAGTK
ncbi:MAG TPA: hypothetical protein VHE12_05790 [bacterium]|nr:hypothetical protein [bacterium]